MSAALPTHVWPMFDSKALASPPLFVGPSGFSPVKKSIYERLILEISNRSNIEAARKVIEHLRRTGSDLPVGIAVLPGQMAIKLAGEGGLDSLFAELPNVFIVPKVVSAASTLFIRFTELTPCILNLGSNMIGLPVTALKGSGSPILPSIRDYVWKDLRMSSDRLEIVLASLEEHDLKPFMNLMNSVLGKLHSGKVRFIVVPRNPKLSDHWIPQLNSLKFPMDVRRVGVDMQSHYEGTGASPILLNLSEGELRAIESIGDITVIGHTWKAGNAGHSIAEPVFVGAPVFFGKYVGFHKPYARVIVSAGAGLRINNLDQLAKKILETVNDPQRPRLRSMRRATATAADRIDQQISGPILNALFTDWLKIPTSSKTLRAA